MVLLSLQRRDDEPMFAVERTRFASVLAVAALLIVMTTGCSKNTDFSEKKGDNSTTTLALGELPPSALDCGEVTYLDAPRKLFIISGSSCEEGKTVVAAHDAAQLLPDGWSCFYGREGEKDLVRCEGPHDKSLVLRDPV